MKKVLFLVLVGFFGFNAQADDNMSANVLAEHSTYIYFAHPEHIGTYKFQIMLSGLVQKVDNKNQRTLLAQLTGSQVLKLKKAINSIKSDELKNPRGPVCADAPSSFVRVQKTDGTELVIYKQEDCVDHPAVDVVANQTAQAVNELRDAFTRIENLEYLK